MPFLKISFCLFLLLFFIACNSSNKTVQSDASTGLIPSLKSWLALDQDKRTHLSEQAFATQACTKAEAQQAVELLYQDQLNLDKKELKNSWENKLFQNGEHQMRIKVKSFGVAPKDGRSLFISMHGGGGAPPAVNDQQWENQIRLYQPKEGIYIAPRAPTDTWNLWHQGHIDPLFDQLIRAAIAFENVNPNKVYLTGYSAGGDGTFQLAPRMADRFAAAAMMAGHPNETTPEGLRNLPFAIWMGANDGAYDRNQKAKDWKILLDSLQKIDKNGYIHQVNIVEGKGHWMDRADTAAIPWMTQFERKPHPKKIVWKQDDRQHPFFYWLEVPKKDIKTGGRVLVDIKENTITILENYSEQLILHLNDQLVDLDQAIIIKYQDKELFNGKVARHIQHIGQNIAARKDRYFAFSCALSLIKNETVAILP